MYGRRRRRRRRHHRRGIDNKYICAKSNNDEWMWNGGTHKSFQYNGGSRNARMYRTHKLC